MGKGVSVHIGLNVVDPGKYGGWNGQLAGCINDANAMEAVASQLGYAAADKLIDGEATAANVIEALEMAASQVEAGDTLLVTYSGHGGQVRDLNKDESSGPRPDRKDETWVLFDRMVLDDELNVVWTSLPPGARVIVVSDSCHSGSVTREIGDVVRTMPADKNEAHVKANRALYQEIAASVSKDAASAVPAARVVLVSGCQDDEVSYDGKKNGAFTEALLKTWNKGKFKGTITELHQKTTGRLTRQHPNLFVIGGPDPTFDTAPALRIGA